MSVEGEPAGRRVPRSGLLPQPRVRITAVSDHEYGEYILCASCGSYHPADLNIHSAGACSHDDFRPVGGATFVSTHNVSDDYPSPDYHDDSAAIARINATYGSRNGPHYADPYYKPSA